jgi:chaperone BCS1
MWQSLMDQLSSNQFLSGGALLAAVGVGFAYLRRIPSYLWAWFKRRIITVIDVPDRDEAFKWLNIWLAQHPYHRRCRLWTVHTKRRYDNGPAAKDRTKKTKIILAPAPGFHFLFYKNRLMILHRDRKEGAENNGGVSAAIGFCETFTFTLFSRNKQIVLDLLEEARQAANPPQEQRLTVLCPSGYDDWSEFGKRLPRPLDSVILADNLIDDILSDIRQFQDSEMWYNERGIPYQRGYLLHGKPGNGKSSLILALASTLQLDICILNLSSNNLNDARLIELMASVPQHSLVLIEDIDCVFLKRKKADDKENVTFSGLLNAIDGVMASAGRVLFMTTNNVETLDAALIRPGRVDMSIKLDNASREQMEQLFLRFFPLPDLAKQFSNRGKVGEWSMATLQGHLLKYRDDPVLALTNPIYES